MSVSLKNSLSPIEEELVISNCLENRECGAFKKIFRQQILKKILSFWINRDHLRVQASRRTGTAPSTARFSWTFRKTSGLHRRSKKIGRLLCHRSSQCRFKHRELERESMESQPNSENSQQGTFSFKLNYLVSLLLLLCLVNSVYFLLF